MRKTNLSDPLPTSLALADLVIEDLVFARHFQTKPNFWRVKIIVESFLLF